jgi:hypothetical protein
MVTVRIEHPITSFERWKVAFDRDPVDRRGSGVRRYQILRPVDDPEYVMIDLDFATRAQASTFVGAMRRVWDSPQAAPALGGAPRVTIAEAVEEVAW